MLYLHTNLLYKVCMKDIMENNTSEKLRAYAEALDTLAKTKSKDIFPNKNHQHAVIAISTILKYSRHTFILFDDNLSGDISKYDEVISFQDSIIEFISRGGIIKIVIKDKYEEEKISTKLLNFLKLIIEIFPKQVELKLASKKFNESMKSLFNVDVNFAVGDKNKYRLELKGNSEEHSKREATGSFNNEEQAMEIINAFESVYDSCENYINNGSK